MGKTVFLSVSVETGKSVQTVGELKTLIKNLKKELEITPTVNANFEPLQQKLKLAQTELAKFNDQVKATPSFTQRMAGALKDSFSKIGIAVAGAFAVNKLIEFGKKSFEVAKEVERDELRLLTALNGRKSIQQSLIAQANQLEKSTGVDDREIVKQQTFLALQGRTSEQIKKTIEGAIRLSKVTGDDLGTSVGKLDATLEGSVGKLGKLDERFKNLTETELKAGAAITLVNEKYADTLNLQGDAEQATNNFENAVEDLEKSFGKLLLKLGPTISALGDFIGYIASIGSNGNVELNIELTNKSKDAAVKDFEATKNAYIKSGKSAEQAITQAALDEIKVRQSLIQQLDSKKDARQIIIYAAQIEALKQTSKDQIAEVKAAEQAKIEASKKSAEEKKKLNKQEFDDYRQKLDNELKALQLKDRLAAQKAGGARLTTEKENIVKEKTLVEKQISPLEANKNRTQEQEQLYNNLLSLQLSYSDQLLAKDQEIYNKELANLQEANTNLINQTQEGTQQRIDALIAGKKKELELLKNAPGLSPDQKANKEAEIQKQILDIKKKGIQQTIELSKTELETKKTNLEAEYNLVVNDEEKKKQLKGQIQQIQKQQDLLDIDEKIQQLNLVRDAQGNLYGQDLEQYKLYLAQKQALSAGFTQTELDEQKKAAENEKLTKDTAIEAASMVTNELINRYREANAQVAQSNLDRINETLDKELSAIDIAEQKERGTYVEKDAIAKKYDAQRLAAKKKQQAEEKAIKKKAAQDEKQAAIIGIILNTALGVMKASPIIPLMVATAALGAVQLGLAASQPIPEFSKGGILNGKSHAQGGISAIVGGTTPVELEGGEAIINKRATSRYASVLSMINQSEGGVAFEKGGISRIPQISMFENGGISTRNSNNFNLDTSGINLMMEEQREFFKAELQKERKSYVVESEITNSQRINRTIEQRALFNG